MRNMEKKINELTKQLSQLENENRKLLHIAYHDSLTGAYNRHWFNKNIKLTDKLYLSIIDINGLKHINDTKGHTEGDKLILKVYDIINKYGKVVRYGGDEFIIISDTLQQYEALHKVECEHFSCGGVKKDEYTTIAEAINIADQRLYEDKNNSQ